MKSNDLIYFLLKLRLLKMTNMLESFARGFIPEAELSLVHQCTLQCNECGFNVPNQSIPWDNTLEEIKESLDVLRREGIKIGSLALLGGEATLAPGILSSVAEMVQAHSTVQKLELVTNGLTPKGLKDGTISCFDRISISQYSNGDQLLHAWRNWVQSHDLDVEVIGRRHGSWDRMFGEVELSKHAAQMAFSTCWYRKHCVTIERSQIFLCSRIPKFEPTVEGVRLNPSTKRNEIVEYLVASVAPDSCKRCVPMAGLSQVEPGIQPDDRIPRLERLALKYLSSKSNN